MIFDEKVPQRAKINETHFGVRRSAIFVLRGALSQRGRAAKKKEKTMKQRVNNISYLAKSEVALNALEANKALPVIALPAGAELISLTLSVDKEEANGQISVGFEGNATALTPNPLDLGTKGMVHNIAVAQTLKENSSITLQSAAKLNAAVVSVRATYFLPSTIVAEF